MEMLFHRINNAFVRRLTLSFDRAHLALPYFLRANASDLNCRLRALRVESTWAAVDYALVDFLGVHFKPQAYEVMRKSELREDHVMLFKRDALHDKVHHLLPDAEPAPNCILPELFGVGVVETCAIITRVDPRQWIGRFIEMFETSQRGTDIVRSVTLIHIRLDKTSLRPADEPLGQPRRSNVPTPHSTFLKAWLREWIRCLDGFGPKRSTATESTLSELFVFENATSAKRLEVHVWAIDVRRSYMPFGLSYAFQLQVVDNIQHDASFGTSANPPQEVLSTASVEAPKNPKPPYFLRIANRELYATNKKLANENASAEAKLQRTKATLSALTSKIETKLEASQDHGDLMQRFSTAITALLQHSAKENTMRDDVIHPEVALLTAQLKKLEESNGRLQDELAGLRKQLIGVRQTKKAA